MIGIIGGSGLYSLIDDAEEINLDTPYGAPSGPLVRSKVDNADIVFLPRHGRDHRFPPHRVPYRANLWALREVGVRQILAPCAVGSLSPDLGPGDLVIPDQVIDRTTRRPTTFFDDEAVHVSFADPYCPRLRFKAGEVAAVSGWQAVDGGTMVVIEGPRFSTRAESVGYANSGASLINMTGMPEAVLARELELCFAAIALVTDRDAGIDAAESVSMDEVFKVFAASTDRLRTLLLAVAVGLDDARDCPCPHALDGTPAEGRFPR